VCWISGEAEGLVPELAGASPPSPAGIAFLYGVVPLGAPGPATPVARAGSHGAWLQWLDR
jgi:hypothetical protein